MVEWGCEGGCRARRGAAAQGNGTRCAARAASVDGASAAASDGHRTTSVGRRRRPRQCRERAHDDAQGEHGEQPQLLVIPLEGLRRLPRAADHPLRRVRLLLPSAGGAATVATLNCRFTPAPNATVNPTGCVLITGSGTTVKTTLFDSSPVVLYWLVARKL